MYVYNKDFMDMSRTSRSHVVLSSHRSDDTDIMPEECLSDRFYVSPIPLNDGELKVFPENPILDLSTINIYLTIFNLNVIITI